VGPETVVIAQDPVAVTTPATRAPAKPEATFFGRAKRDPSRDGIG